ncbi:MAG: aminotransferase class V-fold PLP-dependent enzyme [Deltaproteobacteria bacterium]|nr:aminotransferase class V-fold PLP-dependent enzyme [Deltaproteobacteria bacterium]
MAAIESKESKRLPGLTARQFFPILSKGEKAQLHYLDTAASAQKPAAVIDRITAYLSHEHANIHRGAYSLSANATKAYDNSKLRLARFLGADSEREIIFTKGTTESINLVAHSLENYFSRGDNILISLIEHHSNIVPWQMLARRKGLNLSFCNISPSAEFDLDDYKKKVEELKPKLVAMTHVANSFGTLFPVDKIVDVAHKAGALVLVDAAQSVQHCELDCSRIGADFLAFSGHKFYGPTGIGVLYANSKVHHLMEPFQGGGDMISSVAVEGSAWADFPQRMEAGTPPIAEAIALESAVDFVEGFGLKAIADYEHSLFVKAWELLSKEEGVELYGPATRHGAESGCQVSIISFNLKGVHAHDLSTIADNFNVQIRAGHHCAMPALKHLGIASSARASIGLYSDISDFEALIDAIRAARKMFR